MQEGKQQLDEKFFRYNPHVGRSDNFVNAREVVKGFSLAGGRYAVIPSTYSAGQEGEFYLRVFTGHSRDTLDTEPDLEKGGFIPFTSLLILLQTCDLYLL